MVRQAAVTSGYALQKRFEEKVAKHGEACRQAGLAFIPLVVESLGGWHNQTVTQVKKIGSALARHTGGEEGEVISHMIQRLAVLLAKGNASLLLNRQQTHPPPQMNGIE